MKSNVLRLVPAVGERPRRKVKDIDKLIGESLRLERKAKGRSMDWLGEQLGVTYQQVGKWEHGENRISISRLLAIADVLEFDAGGFLSDLTTEDNPLSETGAKSELMKQAALSGAQALLQYYADMPPEDRKLLLKVARRFAEQYNDDEA